MERAHSDLSKSARERKTATSPWSRYRRGWENRGENRIKREIEEDRRAGGARGRVTKVVAEERGNELSESVMAYSSQAEPSCSSIP